MRKGIMALEAYDQQGTDPNDPLSVTHLEEADDITLEEASNILGDARVVAGEIGRDLSEAERVIQISDCLEDLALVAAEIQKATKGETLLIELVGQVAAAGTEVEPSDVVPSMESFEGASIATEGIMDTAARVWAAIQNFIQKIWAKIRDFWRVNVVTTKYKKTLKDLQQMVKDAGAPHGEKRTFAVTGASNGLMAQMHQEQVWSHLDHALQHFLMVDTVVFKDYANGILKMGDEIAKGIDEFDPKQPEVSADRLRDKLTNLHLKVTHEITSQGFIGNGSLRYQEHARVVGEDASISLERIRLSGLKYTKGATPKQIANHGDRLNGVPMGTVPEMTSVLKYAEKLLDLLEEFYSSKVDDFYKASNECRKASEKAAKEMSKLDKAEFGGRSMSYYRAMLNFNSAFATWTNEPFIPMYEHTLRVVNSLFLVVRGSLTCYQGKK